MSNEHDDKLVSDVYRELAHESTPAELDAKVLKMARKASTSGRGIFPMWMQPLAWAATAALALAIVLQTTQVPDYGQARPRAEEPMSVEEAFTPRDDAMFEEVEEQARQRIGPNRQDTLHESNDAPAAKADSAVPAAESTAFSAGLEARELEDGRFCDDRSRATAADWYACVTELRDAGRSNAANRELTELLQKFPDFQPDK